MKLLPISPAKALNKGCLKQSLKHDQIELFKGKQARVYVEGKFYRGVLTGLNEAFVIDEEAKARLIDEDPKSARAMQMPYMNQLPIPHATDAQQAPIIERVQKNLAAPDSPDVPQLEAEIGRRVYELYGLTDEEIAVVEGKP